MCQPSALASVKRSQTWLVRCCYHWSVCLQAGLVDLKWPVVRNYVYIVVLFTTWRTVQGLPCPHAMTAGIWFSSMTLKRTDGGRWMSEVQLKLRWLNKKRETETTFILSNVWFLFDNTEYFLSSAWTYTKHQTHAQSSIHTRSPFLISLPQKEPISPSLALTLTLSQRKRTFSSQHYS